MQKQIISAKISRKEAEAELAKVGLALERSVIADKMPQFFSCNVIRVVTYADGTVAQGLNMTQKEVVEKIGVNETSNLAAKFVMVWSKK